MTEQVEKEIVTMYLNKESIASINIKYGTYHAKVRKILKKYNVYQPVERPDQISREKVEELYSQGLSGKTIAQRLGSKYTTFIGWCRTNNFDLSKKREYPRRPNDDVCRVVELNKTEFWKHINTQGLELKPYAKYLIDDTFFGAIDTEEKAYTLGYWYADGNTHKGSFQATSTDLDVLEKIKYCMKFTGNITQKINYNNNDVNYYNLYLKRRLMYDDLIAKGCPEKKSLILKFPSTEIVPAHLVHHFIRGYFDGDGSIFCSKTKGWDEWAMAMVGTREFMEGVTQHLNIPVRYTQTRQGRNNWTITFCKLETLKAAINYMYKDATIAMNRKAILADECLQYIYEHQLYKGIAA